MNQTSEQLLDTVLALPDEDRLQLAEALIASLQPTDRPPFDESWREVIRRRSAELASGTVTAVPWEVVANGIRVSLVVPITTFEPEPFEVLKEIKAVVQQEDEEEFSATFFDGNVNAAGSNQVEAIENLKDILLSRFEYLNVQPPEKLAPPLRKQIAVLREFIRCKV
jgi:putative addiction module component (TIGR02574 family)